MAFTALAAVCGLQLLSLVTTLFPVPSASIPLTYNRRGISEESPFIQKRQRGFFSVLGTPALAGRGSLHPRLELRELQKNEDQWNIYLLGLRRFQNTQQSDKLSYYQISGIHGRPYIPWDGVEQVPGGGGGYCTHGSNIFPTWHRPYMALFEEILYANAREAIREFPSGPLKDRYNNALSTLRMPYWDWAAPLPDGESAYPMILRQPTIDVVLPGGLTSVPNPLYEYRFRETRGDLPDLPFSTYTTTKRHPSTQDAKGVSSNSDAASYIDANRASLQSRVYSLLAVQSNYSQASNDLIAADSIESIHDIIHNLVGGTGGHLGSLTYAAFDPIFWLHHANVDRLFALWQAINPDSYVTPLKNPYSTFTISSGSIADENTPLTPFHRNEAGDFWTSDTARYTSTFGYTYPEVLGLNPNVDIAPLKSRINALYGPNADPQTKRSISPLVQHRTRNGIAGAPSFTQRRMYTANIKVRKFGLDGSFNIYIFLGKKPGDDPALWTSEESFVGMTGVLSQSVPENSDRREVDANGAVPLTAALEAKYRSGFLLDLKEGLVGSYLNLNLVWRVAKLNGEQIPIEDVPDLQVSVLWSEIEPAASDSEFPRMVSEYQVLGNATEGRVGGFQFARGDTVFL